MALPKLLPSETNYIIPVRAIYNLVRAIILKCGLKSDHTRTCKDNNLLCEKH
jgi:hypothetical protein